MADFYLRVGATKPSIIDTLQANGIALDITGSTVTFIARKYGAAAISRAATIISGPEGIVRYDPGTGDTAAAGTYECQWRVVYPSSAGTQYVPSEPFSLEILP